MRRDELGAEAWAHEGGIKGAPPLLPRASPKAVVLVQPLVENGA